MTTIRPKPNDAIVEAAFRVFSRRPRASLAEVAEEAGVGRATLHRYFKTREALMATLAKVALEELNAAVDAATENAESHTEGLRLALGAMVPLAERHWFLANEPVEADPEIAAAFQKDRDLMRQEIDAARAEGAFPSDAPTQWIAEAYDALLYAAWTLVREGEATPTQAADLAWRTLTTGVGAK